MASQYATIGILFLGAIGFGVMTIILSRLLQNHRPYPKKLETYECGIETSGSAWVQFKTSYFLYALIFLIFDVEVIFMIPWVLEFKNLGLQGLISMFVFLAILIAGFWYDWKEGALEWE